MADTITPEELVELWRSSTHSFGGAAKYAFDPDQPRDEGGSWTDTGGGSSGGSGKGGAASRFDVAEWKAKGMKAARAEWAALDERQRDVLADAARTVPERQRELIGEVARVPDDVEYDMVPAYVMDRYAERIGRDTADRGIEYLSSAAADMKAAGYSEADTRELLSIMGTSITAQELEAQGRSLGDHGVNHIAGDYEMAVQVLEQAPAAMGLNTPENRAELAIAAAFHDSGYLAPPARAWADEGHPRWAAQNFDANLRDAVSAAASPSAAAKVAAMIRIHADTDLNWAEQPVSSAFRLADNLALFHREKMPPFIRAAPESMRELIRLGRGEISLDVARDRIRGHLNRIENVTPDALARYHAAVDEVSPILPKYTVGLVGARISDLRWSGDHVSVRVDRGSANRHLSKVLDAGQQQFRKFAETYKVDPEQLLKAKHAEFKSHGKVQLELEFRDLVKHMLTSFGDAAEEYAFDPDQPRDESGKWTDTGGTAAPKGVSDPKAIAESLRQAGTATERRSKTIGTLLDNLPDGYVIKVGKRSWTKLTLAGDVFWTDGRKHLSSRQALEEIGTPIARVIGEDAYYGKYAFDPDQPRAPDGKWVSEGGNVVAFHGTVAANLASIKKSGLKVGPNVKRTFKGRGTNALYEGERGESVFVANRWQTAAWYARQHSKGTPVVLELRIPKEEFKESFFRDVKHQGRGAAQTQRTIKPSWIVKASKYDRWEGLIPAKFDDAESWFVVILVEDGGGVNKEASTYGAERRQRVVRVRQRR